MVSYRNVSLLLSYAAALAVRSLAAHRLRTVLTVSAVAVGASGLMCVGTAIEGMRLSAEDEMERLFGTRNFVLAQILNTGKLTRSDVARKLRHNKTLRKEDLDYLQSTIGDEVVYSRYARTMADVVRGRRVAEDVLVTGVSATFGEIQQIFLTEGRFFTDTEERHHQLVCVLGYKLSATLFPASSPLGANVKIVGVPFSVVGVQTKRGSAFGVDQDNVVYLPASAFSRLSGSPRSVAIFGRPRAGSDLSLSEALNLTRAVLRARFRTLPGSEDSFDHLTAESIRSEVEKTLAKLRDLAIPITVVSVLMGGVAILNTMLVTVTERRREIGLRRSLGATRVDILLQFVLEAVIISVAGGLCAAACTASGAMLISAVFGVGLTLPCSYAALALLSCGLTGGLASLLPARMAAWLDPVAALEAE